MFYVKDATLVEKQKLVEVPEAMETEFLPTDVQLPDVDKMAAGGPPVVPDGDLATGGEGEKTEQQETEKTEQQATENMEGTSNDSSSENVSSADTSPEAIVVSK